jgi:acetyl-CoA carboxylase carboxyltransferase component
MSEEEGAGMIDDLVARHRQVLDESRPDMARRRRPGQLTARERIERILDPGSTWLESGALAQPVGSPGSAPADAVVVGMGSIHGRTSVVVSFDYTAVGGSQGMNNHAKTLRAMWLARRHDAPLYLLVEGGGARATEIGMEAGARVYGDFGELARLSGRVPIVGLALGRAFAGHGIFLGECDAVVATADAAMGIAGPPLIKASTGQDLTPEEVGAASIHEACGAVERVAVDDEEALALARAYMAYPVVPVVPHTERRSGLAEELRGLAGDPAPRDVRRIVSLVADEGSLFELRETWETGVVTTFARLAGRAIGMVATGADGGSLTAGACDKIARFVRLCGAYGMPIVLLLDATAFPTPRDARGQALFRHAARLPLALHEARVPVVTVITGPVSGAAQVALAGIGRFLEGPPHVVWPTASMRGLGIPASGGSAGSAYDMAAAYLTDDVIDPGRTRDVVSQFLQSCPATPPGQSTAIEPW